MSVLDNIVADVHPQAAAQPQQTQQPAQPQQQSAPSTNPQQQPQPVQQTQQQQSAPIQPTQQTNEVTFPNQNNQNTDQNNSLHDFITNLNSDDVPIDNSQIVQSNQQQLQQQQIQQQQQQQAPVEPQDQTDALVSNIMQTNQFKSDYVDGLDMEEILPRIGEGDSNAFIETLNKVGENATKSALKHFMSMLPEISKSILGEAGKQNVTQMQEAQEWNNFISKNPAFGPYKQQMHQDLIKAVKLSQGNRETAYNNLAQMYSGFVSQNSLQPNNQQQQQPAQGREFDITEFLTQG